MPDSHRIHELVSSLHWAFLLYGLGLLTTKSVELRQFNRKKVTPVHLLHTAGFWKSLCRPVGKTNENKSVE